MVGHRKRQKGNLQKGDRAEIDRAKEAWKDLNKNGITAQIFEVDLALIILLTLLCIVFLLVPCSNVTAVRTVLGLSLGAFLPGYSLVAALFLRRDDLDGIERVALSFGLSVAVVPLLGLALNYTPFGIRLTPVLIVLSTFTVSLSVVAWFRRLKVPEEERFSVPFQNFFKAGKILEGQTVLDKMLSVILVGSIIASSATLVYVVVTPKTGERFTEFYIFNSNGTASDYPTDLKVGEEGKLIIGIVNQEYENVTYRLEVRFNGTIIHEENCFLMHTEKRETPFTFQVAEAGENQKLELLLYKEEDKEAYRTLHLWVNATLD